MSANISPEHWRKHLDKAGDVGRVQTLHEGNRLGIHVIEPLDRGLLYPVKTREALRSNEAVLAGAYPQPLQKKDVALLSISLPPGPASGKSITPYFDPRAHLGEEIAYGINLDERQPNPARVIRVFRNNGNTGNGHHDKEFHLRGHYHCQQMADLYGPFEAQADARDAALINAVFNDASLSGRQLDILVKYVQQSTLARTLLHNEALVAAAPRHVETILIPIREHKDIPSRVVTPVCTFAGALSGIEHARNGADLPVMLYHSIGSRLGKCSFVAQGEEQCRAAAIKAVRALRKYSPYDIGHINTPLRQHGERLLGIDVYKPLEKQGIVAAACSR